MRRLPAIVREHQQKLFWDVDPERLDPIAHEDFILGRVLSLGSWEDVQSIRDEIGDDGLRAFVMRAPHRLDRRSLRFFQVVLDMEPSCTTTPFRKPSARLFSP